MLEKCITQLGARFRETPLETLPQDLLLLMVVVFVLGLKHGFDADHLATIDGLTRYNARNNPRLARFCGVLFSLGHGAVVVAISLAVSTLARHWQVPQWLELFGSWVSIAFLTALGVVNLYAVLRTDPGQVVQPVGLKGRLLGPLARASHPGLIALVGVLFALSFDTISQAALFALTATRFGSWEHALMLGLLFMLGMLCTDGINGFWISRLIRRTDEVARIASRVMGLAVSTVSLLVAGFGVLKLALPGVDAWSEGKELILGTTVVATIAASFLLAIRLARNDIADVAVTD
jgi:high-affinity nickel-transport protein